MTGRTAPEATPEAVKRKHRGRINHDRGTDAWECVCGWWGTGGWLGYAAHVEDLLAAALAAPPATPDPLPWVRWLEHRPDCGKTMEFPWECDCGLSDALGWPGGNPPVGAAPLGPHPAVNDFISPESKAKLDRGLTAMARQRRVGTAAAASIPLGGAALLGPPTPDPAYAALAVDGTVDAGRYHTDPVYHAVVYRVYQGAPPRPPRDPECSCGGRRWVDDENWQGADQGYGRGERTQGDGLIPCGFCNEGGWGTPVGAEPTDGTEPLNPVTGADGLTYDDTGFGDLDPCVHCSTRTDSHAGDCPEVDRG